MCSQQGATKMEVGYPILSIMFVLHHYRVHKSNIPFVRMNIISNYFGQPTVVTLHLPQMAILNNIQALQKEQELT